VKAVCRRFWERSGRVVGPVSALVRGSIEVEHLLWQTPRSLRSRFSEWLSASGLVEVVAALVASGQAAEPVEQARFPYESCRDSAAIRSATRRSFSFMSWDIATSSAKAASVRGWAGRWVHASAPDRVPRLLLARRPGLKLVDDPPLVQRRGE
jgi:hypothetical protein